ncbi:MAG: DEAD/DEAH box helicase [Anaerolineales bacterium]
MDFNQFNLDSRLNTGIRSVRFHTPTPIQEAAIPLALAGHDLIGTAQTGTGKTAAFVLPILHKLLKGPGKGTRALIITPTRELAAQIHQTIGSLSHGTNLRSVTIYGGVAAGPQIAALRKGTEIVVACPGRLLDHIRNNHANLGSVEILVLDEADRMLDMGFLPDIKRILKHVPVRRQTMLFSATFPTELERLAQQTMNAPRRVAINHRAPAETVSHTLYPVPQHLKRSLLLKLLDQTRTDSVLIFTRTKRRAQRLARQIADGGYKVTSLHGNRTQGQRRQAMSGFKNGQYQIMVATDIASRGLDVARISHVINYDMPGTADDYIHRIGRTGRAERTGEAFTLVTPEDRKLVQKIEGVMSAKLSRQTLPDFNYASPKPEHHSKKSNNANAKTNDKANRKSENGRKRRPPHHSNQHAHSR